MVLHAPPPIQTLSPRLKSKTPSLLCSASIHLSLSPHLSLAMPKHYRPPGKKKEGNAARYITRSLAVRHTQVPLPLFRKLCILKGIFPRVPKKKTKGNHHTYYHTKDIAFLQHEPLLEKFREQRAYEKKIKKASAKKEKDVEIRLKANRPTYTLDKILLQRYPKFVDALRDLDDCLSMVHLFAALPALEREKIPVSRIHNCRRLSHQWQAYISRTHKLRKTFISVKGIYYQAEVEGQKITWLAPHALRQVWPDDVDFYVMLNFLELHEPLLAFVLFRLYQSINVSYPPILDPELEALAAELYALSRFFAANARSNSRDPQTVSSSGSELVEVLQNGTQFDESELRLSQLQHQLPSSEPGALMNLVGEAAGEDEEDEETKQCKSLFKNMKFFLSREVPRESLLFVIPAFGGVVSWEGDGAPFSEADQSITHQIVDRSRQGHVFLSREYLQPQWVYDCVNARIILPTEGYIVGRVPPPHLSPFVDNEAEGYVPEYAETIKRLQAAARKEVLPMPGVGNEELDDPQNMLVEGIINRTEANEAAERKQKMSIYEKQHHDELKLEIQGVQYSSSVPNMNKDGSVKDTEARDSVPELQQIAEDTANMSKVVMSRKKRKLYEAMQIGKERKRADVNLLKERKKKIQEGHKPKKT